MFWILVILLFGLAVFGVLSSFGGGIIYFYDFAGCFLAKSLLIFIADTDLPVLGNSLLLLCGVKSNAELSRIAILDLRADNGTSAFLVVFGCGLPILSSIY